jgi:hypothetical protein
MIGRSYSSPHSFSRKLPYGGTSIPSTFRHRFSRLTHR